MMEDLLIEVIVLLIYVVFSIAGLAAFLVIIHYGWKIMMVVFWGRQMKMMGYDFKTISSPVAYLFRRKA